jgi:hypothetical protein
MNNKRILIYAGLVALLLGGCSSNQRVTPNKDTYYRYDLAMEINGVKYRGVAVPAKAKEYKIKIKNAHIDFLRITSCSRQVVLEKEGSRAEYIYRPMPALEDEPQCPLEIEVYDFHKERHYWGYIDFPHDLFKMQGKLKCNGIVSKGAVTACAARVGLLQKISFSAEMKMYSANAKCNMPIIKTASSFKFYIPIKDKCLYEFQETKHPWRQHKMTILGYEMILPRLK